MEERCASAAICFVSFLPDILDSKAEGRNKYLELLLSVAEKFKKSPYRQVSTELLLKFHILLVLFSSHASLQKHTVSNQQILLLLSWKQHVCISSTLNGQIRCLGHGQN
jgi:hypothetical protein